MKLLTAQNFAKLLLLIFALCIALMLNSCVTYKKCMDKFAKELAAPDTIVHTEYQNVIVPHDSVIYSYVNDTNFLNWLPPIQIGRAKLSIRKTKDSTFIRADCTGDTTIVATKHYQIRKMEFGISPNWRTGFFVLLGAFILALICVVLIYSLKKK